MPVPAPIADVCRLTTVLGLLAASAGCLKEPAVQKHGAKSGGTPAVAVATSPTPAGRGFQVSVDSAGRKWLTPKIPYDVFPEVPSDEEAIAAGREAATNGPPNVGNTASIIASTDGTPPVIPEAPAETAAAKPPASLGSTPPAGADNGWDQILPVEDLQKEIAAVRNDLSQKLRTVGSYNEAFAAVEKDGWLMSALATIAKDHPAAISWKANALLARDAAVKLTEASTARGKQNFNQSQLASEQIMAVLNNNTPPGLSTPDPAKSREETADRAALMGRMQVAFDKLKESGADEAALKKNADVAGHEARVLAALAKFTAHADYTSAGEPEYQAAAGKLISAGREMADAAAAADQGGFKSALDQVGTACNNCHMKYRFEK